MLLLQSVLAAASLRGHEEKERRGGESAPWLSSSVEMLHGVWRYCSEMLHHHARGLGTEWKISFCVSAAVGVGAAAPDLSARWPQCVAVALFSWRICCQVFTCVLLRGQCAGGCAVAGWRERSGGKCVGAAVKSRAGCLAAEGTAHPTQHRSCRAPSITLQHLIRRHQHAARQRMPPPPRVRPEGTRLLLCFEGAHRVAQRRAHNLLAEYAHDTGHWPRSVCVMEDTAAESLLLSGGRTPDFLLFSHPGGWLRDDTTTK
ncbi:trans-sialidase [Trypanosoma cruzi]|nr:trans-sialidase [Trypanosoma cruzi]